VVKQGRRSLHILTNFEKEFYIELTVDSHIDGRFSFFIRPRSRTMLKGFTSGADLCKRASGFAGWESNFSQPRERNRSHIGLIILKVRNPSVADGKRVVYERAMLEKKSKLRKPV
jgi:hypothetical protein